MPARARKEIVDSTEPGFYHCFSRCVRRAFLCGDDEYSGNNYDHRKEWIDNRFKFLASQMAVEVTSTAVLGNHLHTVLRNRPDLADGWSAREVAKRWLRVCPGQQFSDPNSKPVEPTKQQVDELLKDQEKLAECRTRLSSISWIMKLLKEPIARWANDEDDCSGSFWEGRFKSTRLLDIYALVVCSMYVDLNVVRAKIASTPEESVHTSAYVRIQARLAREADCSAAEGGTKHDPEAAAWLTPIEEGIDPPDGPQAELGRRASDHGFLPMSLEKYLVLLDWSGRQIRDPKKGAIPEGVRPILDRLGLGVDHLLQAVQSFQDWFGDFAGRPSALREHATKMGERWLRGCRRVNDCL